MIPLALLTALAGCQGADKDPGETGQPEETGDSGDSGETAETGQPEETGDSGDSGETGSEPLTAAEGRIGAATVVDSAYAGSETWYLVADSGSGATLCEIQLTLTSAAARTDCTDCAWAFDLEISDAAVLTDEGGACAAVLGYDADTVADLNGSTVSYGYAPEYYGHAQVLMVESEAGWQAQSFAAHDEATGLFTYDWEIGYREY